jgi:hypothetical protein
MSPPTNPTATEVLPSAPVAAQATPGRPVILYVAIALAALIAGGVIVSWMISKGAEPAANSNDGARTTEAAVSSTPRPAATKAPLDISGEWRDQLGFVSQVNQQGDGFVMTSGGKGCRGEFVTAGKGTISGDTFELEYTSNYSSGRCAGKVSADGLRMTSSCRDSVCGPFTTSSRRQ